MNYLIVPISCKDWCIHLEIQLSLLFTMFKEMLITMCAGFHKVKWIYLNNAKQSYF